VSVPSPATSSTCYDLRDSAAKCCTSASRPASPTSQPYSSPLFTATVHSYDQPASNTASWLLSSPLSEKESEREKGNNRQNQDRQPFDLRLLPCTRIFVSFPPPLFDVFCSSFLPAPMAMALSYLFSFASPPTRNGDFSCVVLFFCLMLEVEFGRKVQNQIRATKDGTEMEYLRQKMRDNFALVNLLLLTRVSSVSFCLCCCDEANRRMTDLPFAIVIVLYKEDQVGRYLPT
jgi:uncharacterized protein YggT (Ycf19 family)